MTSTMKSEPGVPSAFTATLGVPVSAAATAADGRSADGRGRRAWRKRRGRGLGDIRRWRRTGRAGDRHAGQEIYAD